MNGLHFATRCSLVLTCSFVSVSLLHGADTLRPLRVIQAEHAESQVDENPALQEPRWVVRHSTGLRVITVKSGTVTDVLVHPEIPYGDISRATRRRMLTPDATVFAYPSSQRQDTEELTIARVADGATIVKLDSHKLLGDRHWAVNTYLANDASHLWCLLHGSKRFVRVDLSPEPRVTASQELKGSSRDAFNLFVTGDEPGLVVTATSSPKGGWFRVFDHELRQLYSQRLPQAGVCCAVDRPEPLILLTFPQTATWQLIRRNGSEFKLASSASYGRGRPEWNLRGWSLLAAAISPDGKLLVTSQATERPTISVWNPANGKLVREVQLEGGVAKLDLASHHTIYRLAFSLSGKYLTAADSANAYLIDVSELVKPASPTQSEQR